MKKAERPYGGRPKRDPMPGERVPLSFRVTPDLKAQLDRVAQENGRSVSQELELRLEQSLRKEAWHGGPGLESISNLMTAVFSHAGSHARGKQSPPQKWLQDPEAYGAAMSALFRALIVFYPTPSGNEGDREMQHLRLQHMLMSLARSVNPNYSAWMEPKS